MTMTETNPSSRTNGTMTRERIALTDQLVLSGAGFASHGITNARRVAIGAVETVDTIALGTFDIAEKLADSHVFTEVAAKGIAVARQAWSIGVDAGRDALNDA